MRSPQKRGGGKGRWMHQRMPRGVRRRMRRQGGGYSWSWSPPLEVLEA